MIGRRLSVARGQGKRRLLVGAAFLLMVAGFVGLGVWQLQRRAWKLDLIAQVEARLAAAPSEAPGPDAWPGLTAANDAYRRVKATGRFMEGREVAVQAVTVHGSGYWILAPFQTDAFTVLVNRGFVPHGRRDPTTRTPPDGLATVEGLLRLPEPGGAFLRANDPVAGRWYSRDVKAIAEAEGLGLVAPYFIDAAAAANPGDLPIGGLTVVQFRNNHLSYALTWFGMAAGAAVCGAIVLRA